MWSSILSNWFDDLETLLWIFFIVEDSVSLIQLPALSGMTGDQIRILGAGIVLSILLIIKMFRTSEANKAKRQIDVTISNMARRIEELEKKLAT
jgi:hypothetical protein